MTIAEVASQYSLTPDTLRYYERIGLIPYVTRTPGGNRDYSESDIGWVTFIRHMRAAGVQVKALVEYVRLCQEGEHTIPRRRQILEEERIRMLKHIEEIHESLDVLNRKIDIYESVIIPAEKELIASINT